MANYNKAVNRQRAPGERYGTLIVQEFDTSRNAWKCICDCGKIVYRGGTALGKYRMPNCGCQKSKGRLLPNQLAHKRAIISDYKRHAKDRNLKFNLTDEECIALFEQDCFYCSSSPSNSKTVKPSRKLRNRYSCIVTTYYYNGIDRIDSTKDYCNSNCVSCCNICNWSKRDLSLEDWKLWLQKTYQKMFNDQSKDVGSSDPKRETPE